MNLDMQCQKVRGLAFVAVNLRNTLSKRKVSEKLCARNCFKEVLREITKAMVHTWGETNITHYMV